MMRRKFGKKLWSVMLTVAMVFGLVSENLFVLEADAVEPEPETSTFTAGSTVLGFSGYEWWVIGDGRVKATGTSVSAGTGNTITLWSNRINDFGENQFYPTYNADYANQYSTSALKTTMDGLIGSKLFPDTREAGMIAARDLEGEKSVINYFTKNVEYTTAKVYGAKLWPLSLHEWTTINNTNVRSYTANYWLRSPYPTYSDYVYLGDPAGSSANNVSVQNTNYAVRPAFNLNLPSVLFTSAASGDNKKSTRVGSMTAATTPTGTIKLTAEDTENLNQISLTDPSLYEEGINTYPGGTVSFSYSGARTGTNKYVSAVIYDSFTSTIKAHGVVATSESGTATFTTPNKSDLPLGDYELWIYNEEINGENYTDYASTPIKINFTVHKVTTALKASPYTKVYDTDSNNTVDITAEVNNYIGGSSTIEDTQWFRVPITNTTDYSNSFDRGYESALTSDKGVIADNGNSETKETFTLAEVDTNAKYWFKGTVKESNTTLTDVSYITVDNIYKEIKVYVRGEDSSATQLYDYDLVNSKYGIPYDLDRTTVLSAPSLGYDPVTLYAKSSYLNNWMAKMKNGSPLTDNSYTFTLNSSFLTNSECDNGEYNRFTMVYTKISSKWTMVNVHFEDQEGTPVTVNSQTLDKFNAPMDSDGNVSSFLISGGTYTPPSDSKYTPIGYRVGSSRDFVSCTDFSTFDPKIPLATDVYIVYKANYTIDVEYYSMSGSVLAGNGWTGTTVTDTVSYGNSFTFDTSDTANTVSSYKVQYYTLASESHLKKHDLTSSAGIITKIISSDDSVKVYWADTDISVTYSTTTGGMEFYVDQNSYPYVRHGANNGDIDYFGFRNDSDLPVTVKLTDMRVVNPDGISFVSSLSADNQVRLDLNAYSGTAVSNSNSFSAWRGVSGLNSSSTYSENLGTLDGVYVAGISNSQYGYVCLSGEYKGALSSLAKTPKIILEFTYFN